MVAVVVYSSTVLYFFKSFLLLFVYYAYEIGLQCFDAVGWAAGRASGW